MENKILQYDGFIPPCGIFCGSCPNYTREKNRCEGAKKVVRQESVKEFMSVV